jgi:hypothetical protein
VARLERYSQLNRDLHTHSFLESLRNSGLVITRAQADDMGLTKTGTKEMGKWASHWRPLPNDKRRFGNMADNFVHARLFTEINNMHGTYEGLRALFDGVNDMWDQLGYSDMGNLFQGVLGKLGNFDERLGGVVKFTQIAANQAAIASNIVSNFLFSSLAIGSKLFDTNNWPEFAGAMQDVFGFGAAGLRRPKVMHVAPRSSRAPTTRTCATPSSGRPSCSTRPPWRRDTSACRVCTVLPWSGATTPPSSATSSWRSTRWSSRCSTPSAATPGSSWSGPWVPWVPWRRTPWDCPPRT